MRRARAAGWAVATLAALAMSGYALTVFALRDRMYVDELAASFRARPWGILPHALFGGVALALAPFQFLEASWRRRPALHRSLGVVCASSMFVTGASGLYMAWFANTGAAAVAGFGAMAALQLLCPAVALRRLKARDLAGHRAWMLRAYAVLFSAVTFRLWLPALAAASVEFDAAYPAASWLSWAGNLAWAQWFLRRPGPFRRAAARA